MMESAVESSPPRPRLTILYGSQSGTAQDVAETVAREAKRRHFGIFISALDDIPAARLLEDSLVIFVCSTAGQGDPPDNMSKFWKFLLRKSLPKDSLNHLNYGVIGLGDSSYPKFNVIGKVMHKRLQQLGGRPILATALGDDQHDHGHDGAVEPWLEKLWEKLMTTYPLPDGVEIVSSDTMPQSRFRIRYCPPPDQLTNVDNSDIDAYCQQKPFFANILSNERITADDHFQDVRLIRIDFNGSNMSYKPGEVLMVQPDNITEHVDEFIKLFNLDPDQYIELEQNDTDYALPQLPVPCTIRYLVTKYFDIDCIPRRYFFRLLSFMAQTSELEAERLREFSMTTGLQDLYDYCNRPRRTTLEVLQDFPDAAKHLTLDYMFDLIPRLQPRAFSIASALTAHPNEAHLLMAVVKYKSKLIKPRRGVCSTWLSNAQPGLTKIPVWVKSGLITFPEDETPVIMVGPGTGLAPFRSFIHHRAARGMGNMILFFGCRHEGKDFFCAEEWEKLVSEGKLTLFTAFSRDQDDKIYVQHRIREQSKLIRELILEKNASFFIAGNAKDMPDAVREALESCLESSGMTTEEAKNYVDQMERTKRFQMEAWY